MIRTIFAAAAAVSAVVGLAALADPAVRWPPAARVAAMTSWPACPSRRWQAEGIFTDGATFTTKGGAGGTIGLTEFVG